jgi:hypothetical protein
MSSLIAAIAIAVSSPAFGATPTKTSGEVTDDVLVFSCGSFDVRDNLYFTWRGTEHYDAAGDLIRLVEEVSGVDRLYNPLNDKSVSGTYHNSHTLDLANGFVTQSGLVFRIIVPGIGALFLDVGKYVIDFDHGLTLLAGRHDYFEGNLTGICAYLA